MLHKGCLDSLTHEHASLKQGSFGKCTECIVLWLQWGADKRTRPEASQDPRNRKAAASTLPPPREQPWDWLTRPRDTRQVFASILIPPPLPPGSFSAFLYMLGPQAPLFLVTRCLMEPCGWAAGTPQSLGPLYRQSNGLFRLDRQHRMVSINPGVQHSCSHSYANMHAFSKLRLLLLCMTCHIARASSLL